ncbi:acyl carrier protein [Catenuloplanes indicus]|uniref:Acyl carrier protein n=1 Tax=Catenuloplanes indicus TaxID=137267 RepID=A0AAE4AUL3_9ACTN|nr:acyl carrier protein [Catenuloplanes indicus]MDQ0363885.1 acyl carrier protein [Catenuloplanes indicus]
MTDTSTEPAVTIRDWLIERVAFYIEQPAERVDPDTPLLEMGLDSVYALTICGDVEERFGLIVEPTLPWDHPTVNAMAAHLAKELTAR